MNKKFYCHTLKSTGLILGVANSELNSIAIKSFEIDEQNYEHLKNLLFKNKRVVFKDGVAIVKTHSLTKRELVDKLISINKAVEFNAILNELPLEEKLRWEASPIIAPDYPYITENKAQILAALQITENEFNSIFE